MVTHSVYKRGCISCGREITDDRLVEVGVCDKCYSSSSEDILKIFESLTGKSKNLRDLITLKREVDEWVDKFKAVIGTLPWNTQITWMKRVILGRSFSLVAPTGVGKTTFGIFSSLMMALRGKKSIVILPTTNLVNQVYEKIVSFSKKLGMSIRVIRYSSNLSEKEKVNFKDSIIKGEYDIVIITSSMIKNLVGLNDDLRFDFIFADDVDALLKRSKNIEYVVMLAGVRKEEVEIVLEYLKLRFLLAVSKGKDKFEEILNRYRRITEVVEKIKDRDKGIIVVSSATAKPRGVRVKLFKELFNFEVSSRLEVVRNIGNYYVLSENMESELLEVLKVLGSGGLVFVPVEEGVEYADKISLLINSKTNLKSAVVSSNKSNSARILQEFKEGKIDVLVGVSTYYGSVVRGIDIPERIVYSIFLGMPRFKVLIDPENLNVSSYQILKILSEIVDGIEDENLKRKVNSFLARFRKNLTYSVFLEQGKEYLRRFLKDERYLSILRKASDIVFREIDGKNYVLIPDLNTYIQGSGRTSRLYPGGMTRGISVVIEKDEKLLKVSAIRYKWIEDAEWEIFNKDKILKELEIAKEDRKKLVMALEGKIDTNVKQLNKTVLIVVESPTKAKTISNLLGTPSERVIKGLNCYEVTTGNITFIITASKGHIFELTMDPEDLYGMKVIDGTLVPVYDSIKRCQKCNKVFVGSDNFCKYCGDDKVVDKFNDIISLIELAKEVDEVLLASDPDTEGEKISFDIFAFLNAYLKFLGGKVRRMRFHEVTYHAIMESISNPEDVNISLVEAQLLRRIQDRLIGFGLSEFLKEEFKEENVSAGRVQSPVLGWIVKRFEEYNSSKSYFTDINFWDELSGEFSVSLEGKKDEIGVQVGDEFEVMLEEEKDQVVNPLPPFTTDTVIIYANRYFKMSSDEVMGILQDLFEEGFITYHRTDSTTVSNVGQSIAKEYLVMKNLEKLSQPRGWEAEGAHECIRPTKSLDAQTLQQLINEGIVSDLIKKQHVLIYDLIFRRFISSQMKPLIVKNVRYKIVLPNNGVILDRNVEVIENGWNEIGYFQVDKPLGSVVKVKEIRSIKKPKVSLLSEADVVQMMKQKGIGRPSTYAKIITTLIKRKYVILKNNRLIPTERGKKAYEILASRYGDFVSEERTRYVEEIMDKVEKGYENYFEILKDIFEEYRKVLIS